MKNLAVLVLVLVLAGCSRSGDVSDPGKAADPGSWHILRIGQILVLDGYCSVRRVPGGWVYLTQVGLGDRAVCFIPYSEEGKERSF